MAREKRCLDSTSSGDEGPAMKKPAFARNCVHHWSLFFVKLPSSSSPKRIKGHDGRNLQLKFKSKLSLPLFTGGKVEGEQGAAIHVSLIDANTGHVVTCSPESSATLDVVVLEGDFSNEDGDNWTQEEFDSHVVKEREGKRPLLTGDLQVILKKGVGTLGELTFTDNSSWTRSRKFRLGLKVASYSCEGIRIREAKTEAFTVKDHRGELYKKHYPPALNDEVWRLEKIGKDGSFHKKLNKAGIFTVEDFLILVVRDSQRLRNILGSGMSNKMWDLLVEHARTCDPSGKVYVYYPDNWRIVGVVFNSIHEFSGLIANGQYCAAGSLSDNHKVYVDGLVKKAYENWMHVIEYDAKSSPGSNEDDNTDCSKANVPMDLQAYPSHHQVLPSLLVPEQPPMDSGLNVGDPMAASQLPMQSQNARLNAQTTQLNGALFAELNDNELTHHCPSHSSSKPGFHGVAASNIPPFKAEAEDFLSEEEIRMRSNEVLENEDMQHLLRVFNMGSHGHGASNPCSSKYMPTAPSLNCGFNNEEALSSSGKAVVGWLKLKAALRWGVFTRKKVAERLARLVELDEYS